MEEVHKSVRRLLVARLLCEVEQLTKRLFRNKYNREIKENVKLEKVAKTFVSFSETVCNILELSYVVAPLPNVDTLSLHVSRSPNPI